MTTFYVYAHLRPDFTPFYIGKGVKSRAQSLKSRNPHYQNVISKCGRESVLIEMVPCRSEAEAFMREQLAIKALRWCGASLTNMTNGGEGVSGLVVSEATRRLISQAGKGRPLPEEAKRKISARASGRPLTPEHRAKLSLAWKSRPPISEETKAKIAAGQRLRPPPSLETRAKISHAKKGVPLAPEHIERLAASRRGKPLTPEHTANIASAMVGRVISEEHKEKIRAAVLANWKKRKASLKHGR